MRIGEAAQKIGVETHVLRHWEDEGVVVAARLGNGYRDYDEEALTRLRIVLACRRAGMSLEQIRLALHRGEAGRDAVVRAELARVERQRAELLRTSRFLEHVLTCRHSLMSRCPGCSALA